MNRNIIIESFFIRLNKKLHEALFNIEKEGKLVIDVGDESVTWAFEDPDKVEFFVSATDLKTFNMFSTDLSDISEGISFTISIDDILEFLKSPKRNINFPIEGIGYAFLDRNTALSILEDYKKSW